MNKILAIFIFASALGSTLRAYDAPAGVTLAVKLGKSQLNSNDIAFTEKKDYVHVLFNATPYLKELKGGVKGLPAAVKDIIVKEGLSRFPDAVKFKVDAADIAERDDYGLPAWDKIKLIERYWAKVSKGKKVSIEKIEAKR